LNAIGFKTGDKILKINDIPIVNDSDIGLHIISAKSVTIERNGAVEIIDLPEDFLGQLSSSRSKSLFEYRIPFIIGEVADSSLNAKKDLKLGDIITSINGQKLRYFDQYKAVTEKLKNTTVTAEILRDDQMFTQELELDQDGKFGIRPYTNLKKAEELGYLDIIRKDYTFAESFAAGGQKFTKTITNYFGQLKAIFSPSTGAYKGLGGFKAIYDQFPSAWSWPYFWGLTAFLSIMLAILNLLPIPALDGGHVVFLLFEMVSGRKPSEKFLEGAQVVGFFILIALVLFANGNDVFKALTN
jgi:regulator of sigma E protease